VPWPQVYDPLHNRLFSTLLAALPVGVLLGGIALFRLRAHLAALLGLAVALVIALAVYRMPATAAIGAIADGAAYGFFPIGWIVLNLLFLYQLTVEKGWFSVLRESVTRLTPDPRIQVILVAFSFGAFFEGAAGFGTPVAVTAAILIQLGFKPLSAAGLSLIANTAPVAFGALGTPIVALSGVTGIDIHVLSAMIGRQLPFFSLIVPFWVVWAMAGWRGMLGVWPAALTAGGSFAAMQFLVSNYFGPTLVDVSAALVSLGSVLLLLLVWRPRTIWPTELAPTIPSGPAAVGPRRTKQIWSAWMPWILLSVLVFVWGQPRVKTFFDSFAGFSFKVAGLHQRVERMPPVVPHPTPEAAVFVLGILSATGTAILCAALLAGALMNFSPVKLARVYAGTVYRVRHSLLTIAAMLALGTLTRYGGIDATLGLALARTGSLYPFFGTLLGWLGVALTGSDTASNVLFGSLQTITARQTGFSPILMSAANSTGGVMGKMIDAQSIVVASTVTNWYGHEGSILRFVFFHSVALAILAGLLVQAQASLPPFTHLVVR
jgi:lactate permease